MSQRALLNILWIQDHDPKSNVGGAVITDGYFIDYLENSGHYVKWGGQDPCNILENEDFDIAVICNAKWNKNNYSQQLRSLLKDKRIKWVKHEHDHACKWRALFPMVNRCQRDDCPSKIDFGWQYEEAEGLIYLSPFQKEAHDFWNGFRLKNIPYLITPPYVNYAKFILEREHERKKDSVMLLAGMYDFKGYYSNLQFAREHKNYNYNNYTRSDVFTQDQISIMDKVGLIPKDGLNPNKVAEEMSKHEMFLHLSDGFLPFERVVMEAFFAGCKVITNRNVGATSYDWWGDLEKSIEAMDNTRDNFRKFLENIAK